MDENAINEHIRNFAICGLISGILTTVFVAAKMLGFNYYSLIDAFFILALTGLTFFKKSRTAATLMVVYWILNILVGFSGVFNLYALIIKFTFLFFFIMGMIATYRFHKQVLHEKGIILSLMTRRVLAALIEIFLLPITAYFIIGLIPEMSLEAKISVWQVSYFFLALVFWLAISIYIVFKDAMPAGQSLAKKALGLRVVDRYSRIKCRWWQSLVRNIVLFVPFAVLIELVVVFSNSERRRIGDFLARTVVVDASEEYKPKPKHKKPHIEFALKTIAAILAAVFLIAVFYFVFRYINERNISERIRASDDCVVTIWTYDRDNKLIGFGSGFFVNSHGVAVTNQHVIAGAYKAVAIFRQKEAYPVESVIDGDPFRDIAVLKVKVQHTPYLRLGDSDRIKIGDEIYSIGSPIGLSGTVSKGIISQIREVLGMKFVQTDAAISPGSSGGPMLNRNLEVIGINVAFMRQGQNLNFAIPINYAKGMLDGAKVEYNK